MNYPISISPNIQTAMIQIIQPILTSGPLPTNCFIVTIPMQQAQQMFSQLMMNYAYGDGQYQDNQQQNVLVPYSNYYSQGYGQNYNYPIVPYNDYNNKSKKKKTSWEKRSRLFGHHHRHHHHSKQQNQESAALNYDQKTSSSKKGSAKSAQSLTSPSSSSSSSSTTSDETIR
ncbi:unnamed protein product [Rotaria sp. Silwood1]|nr:unnamed protein product [Rotaria sp. Silwood1]CAF3909229.1 unnamed protein product [Rotaria sp. Silwood1]CAF5066847.1 unnamed protein product [Rotaria sp. Silwood1]CAF5134508.1 unnamed protein product [Rotaria sp. Silwood1]